jgi:SAM-dependent methyltransferase
MKSLLKGAYHILRALLKAVGYEIELRKINRSRSEVENGQINLNIAAGSYVIPGFKCLDIYTPHYYKTKEKFLESRVQYDLRSNNIPFTDGSVDNIYISHAIEHVENEAVEKFIYESFRVLRKGGVLRIACPDAAFLYAVSQFNNDYWKWRVPSLSNNARYTTDWDSCSQYDYLLRELATPRMRFYNNNIPKKVLTPEQSRSLYYEELVETLKNGLEFRMEHPGDHINNWDFNRLNNLGRNVGFKHVIESKYRGSVSESMNGLEFDRTHPQMSLYVEMIK